MPVDFYIECFLRGSTGDVKLAELACERTTAAYGTLTDNLDKLYRAEDGERIQIRLRKATQSDVAVVAALVQAKENPDLQAAWADAAVRLASGTQKSQFNSEDCAPAQWVEAIESARIGNARWRDASWGNNAAPSWELFDGHRVLAEAFYYSVENTERCTNHFDGEAYVQVIFLDRDDNATRCFETSQRQLIALIEAASEIEALPSAALTSAANTGLAERKTFWTDIA